MQWTLEVVVVPVADVDRAKAFYAEQLGFAVDHDTRIGDGMRVVQLTPPGSGCSVVIGEGVVPAMEPGSLKGMQLVVPDLEAARAELLERGVDAPEDWEDRARAAFLEGYHSKVEPSLLPPGAQATEQLLTVFELEKVVYELRYELNNRPDWVAIPVAGIVRLLESEL